MIRIIGGKRYDTDTATEIHSFISLGVGYDTVTETLYLSPNKQLFIARYTEDGGFETDEIVDAGNWRLFESHEREPLEWLERADAPESAYIAIGVEIEEG